MIRDGAGVYGSLLHYTMLIALFGSTALVFFYLYRKDRLSMDEEASLQMMRQDDDEENENDRK